ncbi:MAG: hypothetical protein Q7T49_00680 [bacterium]|nr:hypothetical protein [bacterium]
MTWIIFSFSALISIFLINTVPGTTLGPVITNLFFWLKPDASGKILLEFSDILTAFGAISLIIFCGQIIYHTWQQKNNLPIEINWRQRLTNGLIILFLMFLATAITVPFMSLAANTSAYGMLLVIAFFALLGLAAYSLIIFISWLEEKLWTLVGK